MADYARESFTRAWRSATIGFTDSQKHFAVTIRNCIVQYLIRTRFTNVWKEQINETSEFYSTDV